MHQGPVQRTMTLRPVTRIIALLALIGAGHVARGSAPEGFVITHVNVVDVEGGRVLADRTVHIQGEKIVQITDDEKAPPKDGPVVIDGKGHYLIPGLFDAHVHYIDPDTYGRLCIVNGVTFVRDMGGTLETVLATRDQLNRGTLLGPEMIVTGHIVDGVPPIWPFSEACDTPEQGRAAVNKLADAGVNQIKVYSLLKADVFRAVVDEATKRGLKAVGHVPESVSLEEAMKAGQKSCEHLTGFGAAVARLAGKPIATSKGMESHIEGFKAWQLLATLDRSKLEPFLKQVRESGMVQCPTLVVMKGISRMADDAASADARLECVPAFIRQFWEGGKYGDFGKWAGLGIPPMQKMVLELHRAGVPLMCGTDLANPNVFAGSSVHDEMMMFQGAGIPAADVLRCATLVPARFCGVGERLGTVSVGKTASLVLLEANPLEDIKNVTAIAGVFLKGRYFSRKDLNRLLDETRQLVKASQQVAESSKSEVKLEAPGEIIVKGRYLSKFGQWDAGDEPFVVSRSKDGFHLMAHTRPKGGPFPASVTTLHAGPDYIVRSAEWRQLSDPPLVATYVVGDGKITANAMRGSEKLPEQVLELPADALISGPVNAADFMAVHVARLEVGQKKAFNSVGFGFPDWRLMVTKLTVERLPDEPLKRGDKSVQAARYSSVVEIPGMGTLTVQTWIDERGVPLKSQSKMPWGEMSAEME